MVRFEGYVLRRVNDRGVCTALRKRVSAWGSRAPEPWTKGQMRWDIVQQPTVGTNRMLERAPCFFRRAALPGVQYDVKRRAPLTNRPSRRLSSWKSERITVGSEDEESPLLVRDGLRMVFGGGGGRICRWMEMRLSSCKWLQVASSCRLWDAMRSDGFSLLVCSACSFGSVTLPKAAGANPAERDPPPSK
ncbi:hypothetical protein TWF696_006635 [Orbilia brochopaga]|uniref:Uncharacterized protein n=1 Tax=Orbilia brochopaga TaxID=3140254 RepID=A0AAV9USS6_9PEZI